jgi:alcohol dehydrogenase
MFDFHQPVRIRFGAGCSETLGEAVGDQAVCVLSFSAADALGLKARWQAMLGSRLLAWVSVPDGLATLDVTRQLADETWPILALHPKPLLIGLGGGSVLDQAKIVRVLPDAYRTTGFDDVLRAIRGEADWPSHRLSPLWLLPTTAGTGSEVTRWATLWDTSSLPATKRSFDEPWGYAERAFIDPELALTAPLSVKRDCGLDALGHALEALWNRHANPLSDDLAIQAARGIIEHLPNTLTSDSPVAYQSAVSLAALKAGLAFSQTRTALAHALSYRLTLESGVSHGLAVAAWLPRVWGAAIGASTALDQRLDAIFERPINSGASALIEWLSKVNAPSDPSLFGVNDAEKRMKDELASARGRNFVRAIG